ncbi:MAG: hypothetical protein ACI97K_001821 [Glaciecola sp.]
MGHDERGAGQIMSSKLFQLLSVLIVVMLIGAGLYRSVLDNSESWEKAGFESIKASMQKGLAQMHWQWEYEGRPATILYETAQTERVDKLAINLKGWPALAQSKEACIAFLNIFAGSVLVEVSFLELNVEVERQLGIQIEFIGGQETNELGERVDMCRYSRTGQQFEYQLGTGNLF